MIKEIKVGAATCGIASGALKTLDSIKNSVIENKLDITVSETGCIGMCYREPLVELIDENKKSWLYGDVSPERAKEIINNHILNDSPNYEWIVRSEINSEDTAFFEKQKRIVLQNCGKIDPNSIEDYLNLGGYSAIRKVLKEYSQERVIKEIELSGLRGRGGGGFITGKKWDFARNAVGDIKYLICNADEGDPGAFMDRSVLESDPHSVIEGMMIAGYAIGADEAYIYCRAEYPKAIKILKNAISQCESKGFLGNNIFGSSKKFIIKIKEGAGAFVCGEETALIASIEGKRGMPRFRPPFPASKGLWGKPTNINNVETYANVAWIINNGYEKFAEIGTENSKGTKVFALAGKIKRGGLVEAPMGLTINEIVFDIGGGIKNGKIFKAAQMGGPSGGCIPASLGDLQIDYQQINKTGAIMGSGGLIVLDEDSCMVELAKYFLKFTQEESCGKCTFCRVGAKRMLEILERISSGDGKNGDIEELETLGMQVKNTSLCGLGQSAPNPALTTIKYFREEYEVHIKEKKCPAKKCSALLSYSVIAEKCVGCTLCARECPSNAISGESKKAHKIDGKLCIKCDKCFSVCNFNAIEKQ